MGFGRGAFLWLLGVPLPIVILLALFWRLSAIGQGPHSMRDGVRADVQHAVS